MVLFLAKAARCWNYTRYLWDEASTYGDVIAEFQGTTLTAAYTLDHDRLLSQTTSGATAYFAADALGSTRAGTLTTAYTYGNGSGRGGANQAGFDHQAAPPTAGLPFSRRHSLIPTNTHCAAERRRGRGMRCRALRQSNRHLPEQLRQSPKSEHMFLFFLQTVL
jgi:hypothetical protein